MDAVRIDKWLWAARFFKTRSLAAKACELGRVHANGQNVKPARDVKIGDLLRVKNESAEFEVEVLALSDVRGPAPIARALYQEKSRKVPPKQFHGFSEGRPTKRDRRQLGRLRGES